MHDIYRIFSGLYHAIKPLILRSRSSPIKCFENLQQTTFRKYRCYFEKIVLICHVNGVDSHKLLSLIFVHKTCERFFYKSQNLLSAAVVIGTLMIGLNLGERDNMIYCHSNQTLNPR